MHTDINANILAKLEFINFFKNRKKNKETEDLLKEEKIKESKKKN